LQSGTVSTGKIYPYSRNNIWRALRISYKWKNTLGFNPGIIDYSRKKQGFVAKEVGSSVTRDSQRLHQGEAFMYWS